jgi:hypothetical protein
MRFPFITPGTSKTTIYNGLVTKKILQQNSVLTWTVGGATDDVTANHVGQTPVTSAGTTEGTIYDTPKNRVKILDAVTKDTLEYNPGTGAREIFGRLTYLVGSWLLDYYYIDDTGAEINVDPTAVTIPGFSGDIDYWYAVRTNLRDVVEEFAISDIRELPIDADKYAPDRIVALDGTGTDTTIVGGISNSPVGGVVFVKDGDYTSEGTISVGSRIIQMGNGVLVSQFNINGNSKVIGGNITTINLSGNDNEIVGTTATNFNSVGVGNLLRNRIYNNTFGSVSIARSFQYSYFCDNYVTGAVLFSNIVYASRISNNYVQSTITFSNLFRRSECSNNILTDGVVTFYNLIFNQVDCQNIENNHCDNITITQTTTGAGNGVCRVVGNHCQSAISITTIVGNISVITDNRATNIALGTLNGGVVVMSNISPISLTTYTSGYGYFAFNTGAVTLPGTPSENLVAVMNGGDMNSMPIYSSDPASPVTGDTWFNSTSGQFKGYNGTAVVILG